RGRGQAVQAGHPPGRGLAGAVPEPGRRLGRGPALLRRPAAVRAGRVHRVADRVGAAGPARGGGAGQPRDRAGHRLPGADAAFRRDLGRALVHRHRLPRRLLHQLPPVPAGLPGQCTRQVRTWRSLMTETIICAPMRVEARAIRHGLRASENPPRVLRTGYGTRRSADRAEELKADPFGQLVVMGVGAGLTADLSPGDLVVATEAGLATCPSAPLLAAELRRAGLTVRTGRITTVDHLVRRAERAA